MSLNVTESQENTLVMTNGTELTASSNQPLSSVLDNLELCSCGKESEYGLHGVNEKVIYHAYYCRDCYLKLKKV